MTTPVGTRGNVRLKFQPMAASTIYGTYGTWGSAIFLVTFWEVLFMFRTLFLLLPLLCWHPRHHSLVHASPASNMAAAAMPTPTPTPPILLKVSKRVVGTTADHFIGLTLDYANICNRTTNHSVVA